MPARTAALALTLTLSALAPAFASAQQETLHVYGPGGPAPAMKEAAMAFGQARGVKVEVTAGPTDGWIEKARADADLVFSGSEYMMTDLVKAMEGRVVEETIDALYMRPSAILVRPGNPRKLRHLPDLARAGVKVLVGGSQESVTLQPLALSGRIGLSAAAGVANLSLRYQGHA